MSRGPLLSLTDEYLVYRDTLGYAISQQSYIVKALLVAPKGGREPRLRKPVLHSQCGVVKRTR